MRSCQKSQLLFKQALKWIPGGVNSPVRAFRAVGGEPFFAVRANGAKVWDADNNEYIVLSVSQMIPRPVFVYCGL